MRASALGVSCEVWWSRLALDSAYLLFKEGVATVGVVDFAGAARLLGEASFDLATGDLD